MNTKSLEKFEVLNSEMLASVEGGGWMGQLLWFSFGSFRWWWTNSRSTKWGSNQKL